MNLGLMVTFAGILVAGVAGVLGVWMERDRDAPQRWAWVFSALIVVAVGIEMVHSVSAAAGDAETEERMASVLEQLAFISENSDNPALKSFVGSELAAQARNNPEVMSKVGEKIAAKGGDPNKLRRQAAVARRKAAGLPARRPPGAARPGSKAGKGKGKGKGKGSSKGKGKGKGKGKSKGGKSKSKGGKSGKKGGKGKGGNSKSKGGKSGGKSGKSGGGKKGGSSSKGKSGGNKSKSGGNKSGGNKKSSGGNKKSSGGNKGGKKGGKKKR